jgi:hypothetical protein
MREQHGKKYKEYIEALSNKTSDPETLQNFFSQSVIQAFYEKQEVHDGGKRYFTISKNIVDVIVREMLFDDDEESNAIETAMKKFVPNYKLNPDGSKEVLNYQAIIKSSVQLDYVVRLLAAGLSFNQISRVCLENRELLGTTSKTGSMSPMAASDMARVICAASLQILSDLMESCWSFAIAADVSSTDDFGCSHLDTRIRIAPVTSDCTEILSFHFMAIPLFSESHSGESLFKHMKKLFDALCPAWRDKLIGSTTDGAPNMTGCLQGFTTRLEGAATSNVFYRVWCLAHQLDIIVKNGVSGIEDHTNFPFIGILTTFVGWLRRQDILIRDMGSKCPYLINVRWTSLAKVLRWLLRNRGAVCAYAEQKEYTNAPSKVWWCTALIIRYFFDPVLIAFDTLQVEAAVVENQYLCLNCLIQELQGHAHIVQDASKDATSTNVIAEDQRVTLGQFSVDVNGLRTLCGSINIASSEMYDQLNPTEIISVLRNAAVLYLVTLNGVVVVSQGRQSSHRQAAAIPPCLPLNLANMSTDGFVSLVRSHESRLKTVYDANFIDAITDQHKLLIHVVNTNATLRAALESSTKKTFAEAWRPAGQRFDAIRVFAGGIGAVMPTTSRVEGDFSLMGYRKDSYCAAMSNFSLEGVMHSMQFSSLQKAALYLK